MASISFLSVFSHSWPAFAFVNSEKKKKKLVFSSIEIKLTKWINECNRTLRACVRHSIGSNHFQIIENRIVPTMLTKMASWFMNKPILSFDSFESGIFFYQLIESVSRVQMVFDDRFGKRSTKATMITLIWPQSRPRIHVNYVTFTIVADIDIDCLCVRSCTWPTKKLCESN